ncbi:hypothetical protein [Streptomyces sp. NPDC101249]|uniref:hypothetical protein n=1 Tax=Streptomyces sp. NPDC101249 TaxID=3366140 RepID=UPI00381A85EA
MTDNHTGPSLDAAARSVADAMTLLGRAQTLLSDAMCAPALPADPAVADLPSFFADGTAFTSGGARMYGAAHAVLAARWLLRSAVGAEMPGGAVPRAYGRLRAAMMCADVAAADFPQAPPEPAPEPAPAAPRYVLDPPPGAPRRGHLWAVPDEPMEICTEPDTGGNGGSLPCLACGVPVCACEAGHLRGRDSVRTCDACGNPFYWLEVRPS